MRILYYIGGLMWLMSNLAFATGDKVLITLYCPPREAVKVLEPTVSWAKHHYRAWTSVAISAINPIELSGDGDAAYALAFHAATWTDRTFLCLYNEGLDAIVLAEGVLEPYVKRCYFDKAYTPFRDACDAADPMLCPLTCELLQ